MVRIYHFNGELGQARSFLSALAIKYKSPSARFLCNFNSAHQKFDVTKSYAIYAGFLYYSEHFQPKYTTL